MTASVEKIADGIQALPDAEFQEFLSWLADYELEHPDHWDQEMTHGFQPGRKLDAVLRRVRNDISEGRTKPLDEVIDDS